MTTYKGIKGFSIQTVAGDPANLETGMIWYDSVARKVQGAKLSAAAWASSNNVNTARTFHDGAGTQTAGLIFAGRPPESTLGTLAETYDGSSWTEVGDLNAARYDVSVFGTSTAAIGAGGDPYPGASTNVEIWNGSSWTETTELNTGRGEGAKGAAGTVSTAGLVFGGPPNVVEVWNGSAWTESAEQNTAKQGNCGFGSSTAALSAGGSAGGNQAIVEEWDGSSWTEVADLNTARGFAAGDGTTSAAFIAAGGPGSSKSNATEEWTGQTIEAVTFTSS